MMRSNAEAVKAHKLKSAQRNAELVPDYPFKKMKNGKTFIYYKTCSTPCAVYENDKMTILTGVATEPVKGQFKKCLMYLKDNRIGQQ